MNMTSIIICISFFLDGLLSVYQNISFLELIYFKPMFTIAALSLIYLWYLKNQKYYYRICLITGFFYDLLYTNTLPLNILIFLMLGLIIQKLYSFFKINLMNGIIINLITITTYHIITFIILFLIGYLSLDLSFISHNFLGIIITNSIFYIVLYFIFRRDKHSSGYSM
jgi:rod shape-determining protein MreD